MVGTDSTSSAEEGIVLGKGTVVREAYGVAIGSQALGAGENGTAIGTKAQVYNTNAQSFW